MFSLASALFFLQARSVLAEEVEQAGSSVDFSAVPLSVATQGNSGNFGRYDVLRVLANPALLANQPTTWEVGFSDQTMLGFGKNVWGLVGAWAGPSMALGTPGAAVVVSGSTSLVSVEELDVFGAPTGTEVTAGGLQFGGAGMVSWGFASVGLGLRFARASLDGLPDRVSGLDGVLLDAGFAVALGYVEIGASFRGLGLTNAGPEDLDVGVGIPMDFWWFPTSVLGVQVYDITNETCIGGGMEMLLSKYFILRSGAVFQDITTIRGGFTVPVKDFALDYAFLLEPGGSLDHLFAVRYLMGKAERITLKNKWDKLSKARRAKRKGAASPSFVFGAAGATTLAVGAFEPIGGSATDAAVIADLFRNEIVKGQAFSVVEKSNMDKILQEQAFQQTGCTSQECAVKLGKILNVKLLVVGSFGKMLGQYVINVRVIDVETAQAVYSDVLQIDDAKDVAAGVQTLATRLTAAVKKGK